MGSDAEGAFFATADGEWFEPNDVARGPWDAGACHGGPVAGLLARAVERAVPTRQLTRLAVELLRPVPMRGFRVRAELGRNGRTLATTLATVTAEDGELCARASGIHLALRELGPVPTPEVAPPAFEGGAGGSFPSSDCGHDRPYFVDGIEVVYPPGETTRPGPTTLWMRTVPLLTGEPMSPFQRLCPLADCGNGISRNAEFQEMRCLNVDLTIAMHRAPSGEWLASSAISHWEPTGVGLARATLFDTVGPVASVLQTLVLRRPR